MIKKIMFKIALIYSLLLPFYSYAEPVFNSNRQLDFGTILGFSGSCYLDAETETLYRLSGNFCPNSFAKGFRAEHVLIADPNTEFLIKFKTANVPEAGLVYEPDGVFVVDGLADVPINADSSQVINTGSSGTITMYVGGTLTSSINQPPSFNYSYVFINGIEWNVY
jgi:hypothetical protein